MSLPGRANSSGGPAPRTGAEGRGGSSQNHTDSLSVGEAPGTSGAAGTSRKRVRESGTVNGDGGTTRFAGMLNAAAARTGTNTIQLEAMNISPSLSLSEDGMMAVGPLNNGVPTAAFPHELHPGEIDPDDPNGDDDVEEDIDFHPYHSTVQPFDTDVNSLALAAQNRDPVSATFVPYYPHLGVDDLMLK